MIQTQEGTIDRYASGRLVAVSEDATVRDVVDLMSEEDVGAVMVMDLDSLVGLVSERDVIRALASDADLDNMAACDLMTSQPACADVDDSIEYAVTKMGQLNVRHLPIMRGDRVVGVVSSRDLVAAIGVRV